jgi:hypothetical protein
MLLCHAFIVLLLLLLLLLLVLLQVVLQAVDALVAANADNVLRAGYKKVRQLQKLIYSLKALV